MYVYKITNLINQKSYIGSTNNWERRKKEHFNSAHWKSAYSYNYPLQRAIRKYGDENFSFEILEECGEDIVFEREQYYIIYYNTLTNTGHGYNQTINTYCAFQDPIIRQKQIEEAGVKCALVDEKNNILQIFNSYHEAARQVLNINDASCIRNICNGNVHSYNGYIFRRLKNDNTLDIPINKTHKRRQKICGISVYNKDDIVYYDSISQAAREENISRQSIQKCLAGKSRYSQVGLRIWRKFEKDKIVDNSIKIDEIIEKYKKKGGDVNDK